MQINYGKKLRQISPNFKFPWVFVYKIELQLNLAWNMEVKPKGGFIRPKNRISSA